MFYVATPNVSPRAYELTDSVPKKADERYEALATPIIVHSKMYGSHDKPQPYVVRGVARGGRLLVQTTVGTEYDPVGHWHEVDGESTVEGYRFKRYALKPLMTIVKVGLDAAKVRAREAAKREKEGERAERCGTCPVCFGDFVVSSAHIPQTRTRPGIVTSKMVHHGYQRPGHGYIVGDCHGVGFEPFEVSCEGTKSWLNMLRGTLNYHNEAIRQLDIRDEIAVDIKVGHEYVRGGFKAKIEKKTLKRGEEGFERAVEERHTELTMRIEMIERDIKMYTQKINEWKPQLWPRKAS